jgi:nitrite reductase/ring-hydroxylating ferredoxin subunit
MAEEADAPGADRRGFLATSSGWLMAGGLLSSYGACASMGARYLFPARPRQLAWLYAARVADVGLGQSVAFRAPTGERIAIARQDDAGTVDDFIALSSVCPHLGCQVHWEAQNDRFFCPCHNGVFTPEGKAVEGPPAEAGQDLSQFPLKIEDGLLYIEVPVETLSGVEQRVVRVDERRAPGPGHDPCLEGRGNGEPA